MSTGVSSLRSSSSEVSDLALSAEESVVLQPTEPVPSGAAGYLCFGVNGFSKFRRHLVSAGERTSQ